MPLITSAFKSQGIFINGHFSTIYSAKIRVKPPLVQTRERLLLKDRDFLDLDLSLQASTNNQMAVLLHGLEGNAQRSYIKGQGKYLHDRGWDICAVNYRGCSGEPNKKYSSYNAGKTDDLHEIIVHLTSKYPDHSLVLIGFSLGGNLLLKYLGEGQAVPKAVKTAVAVSAPLSLRGSLESLSKPINWVYRTSFLMDLKKKYRQKLIMFEDELPDHQPTSVKSLLDFDNIYTAPAHGFVDAYDYYAKNSSRQFVPNIQIPVLILNALNDSFLSRDCYPFEFASDAKNIYLETPKTGGHVGFYQQGPHFYNEKRAFEFINEILN